MEILPQALTDTVLLAGLYTLMAVGLSLGFGVTRIINFAHGEFIMLGAYGAFWMLTLYGIDPLMALPLLVVTGFFAGWGLFKLCIEKVLDAPHLNQILVTFGIGLVLQHVAVILWTGNPRSTVPDYAHASTILGPMFVPHGRLIACLVAVVAVLALLAWLKWAEYGRATRAVAENHTAATLMGINVKWMYALSFAINSALGVATGVVVSFIINITPFMGFPMLVKAIAIVILGGMGSVAGTVAGALVLAATETMLAYYVPEGQGWAEGAAFVLLVLILLLRPRGIVGHAVAH